MKERFFDLAKKMSKKSNHPEYKIGGCIVNNSKIISLGFNKYKTHSRSNHPYKHIHCEMDCILGVDTNSLEGSTLYLYRENKQGTIASSKPCKWCNELIKKAGIKFICYTDYGDFKKERVRSI